MLGKNCSRQHFEVFFLFSQKIGFDISCKLHEMSKPIFWEKENEEKYSQYVICLFSLEGIKNFSIKIFVVATHQMCLGQALIMSTQNMLFFFVFFFVFFYGENITPKLLLHVNT